MLGDETYIAKGYKPVLVKNEGYADVAYEETPELIEQEKLKNIKDRINLINLPSSLKDASFSQIDLKKNRDEILNDWLILSLLILIIKRLFISMEILVLGKVI